MKADRRCWGSAGLAAPSVMRLRMAYLFRIRHTAALGISLGRSWRREKPAVAPSI